MFMRSRGALLMQLCRFCSAFHGDAACFHGENPSYCGESACSYGKKAFRDRTTAIFHGEVRLPQNIDAFVRFYGPPYYPAPGLLWTNRGECARRLAPLVYQYES